MNNTQCFRLALSGFLALITFPAQAAIPGLYIGTQIGMGNVSNSGISEQFMSDLIADAFGDTNFSITTFDHATTSGYGFAGRVFMGYQIGYFWGIEGGWRKFSSLPVNATAVGPDFFGAPNEFSASTTGRLSVTAFDLIAKGIIPLPYCFNLYGTLGLAYLQGYSHVTMTGFETIPGPGATFTSTDNNVTSRFYPTFGIGLGYDLKKGIEADLSYSRIQKVGNSTTLGSTDFAGLGLIFHFDV